MKQGTETSEFSLAKVVIYGGLVLEVAAAGLEALKAYGVDFGWLPAVTAVVGGQLALFASLGYMRARTRLKLGGSGGGE